MIYLSSTNVSEDFVLVLLYRKFLSYKAKIFISPSFGRTLPRRWTSRKRSPSVRQSRFLVFCFALNLRLLFSEFRIPNSEFSSPPNSEFRIFFFSEFRIPNYLLLRIPNSLPTSEFSFPLYYSFSPALCILFEKKANPIATKASLYYNKHIKN